jgi:hypothetical protein
MQDFNDYVNDGENSQPDYSDVNPEILNLVKGLAGRFDGKNQNELIKAIYLEAKKGKENGTLSNADIDNFVATLSPMLDDKKRKMLYKIAEELKKI